MRRYRTTGAIALAVALAALFAGCTARGDTSRAPSESRVVRKISSYPYPLSIESAMDQSVIAVEGTVSKVFKPTWDTADRKKPSESAGGDSLPAIIYTSFRVKVDRVYKGEVGSYLDVKAFGGTVDGETVVFEDYDYVPREGERVVVLVQQVFTHKNGDELAVPRSLYTVRGTQLTNEFGGDTPTISVSDVARAAK